MNLDEINMQINMFGKFAIYLNGALITEQTKRSTKEWKLIQYLIVHRDRAVPKDELINALYMNEDMGIPNSALRTIVYRARSALISSGLPFGEGLILSIRGGYRWNNDAPCTVDIEEFEALIEKAGAAAGQEERLGLVLQAADIYHGSFLPNSAGEMWVISLERRYRSMFISIVHEALGMLVESGLNDKVEELCAKGLRTDPFDEKILEYHLSVLLAQGKNAEAADEYRKTEAMFYDVLGVAFSDTLRSLYSRMQSMEVNEGKSLARTLNEWLSDADFPGAYYCDANVLKSVFQIEARSAARSGRMAYIVRFDVRYRPDIAEHEAMKQLGKAIPANLRKGDLFARIAANQYMLMLNSLTYDNCEMLIDRIIGSLDIKNQCEVESTSIIQIKPIL